jgi:hypothetical protein
MLISVMKSCVICLALFIIIFGLASCSNLNPFHQDTEAASTPRENPDLIPPPSSEDFSEMGEFPEVEARGLIDLLVHEGPPLSHIVLEHIVERGDKRFISVFIELLRAAEIGILNPQEIVIYAAALEQLSGQSFGSNWADWIRWYGATDLEPPPGFTGWKGQLLSFIDPRFADFLSDVAPSTVRVEEILWGGVVVDGIPAIDNPRMIPAAEENYLERGEPVFGVFINGEARAYPLRIMDWHEMVNDVVGGTPISLAYCTLCGAGILFDGRASDGNLYTFGSSGFLYRSNKLMYDRQTNTLWIHMTGAPVVGELAGSDIRLTVLPMVLTRWEDWVDQHPGTLVMALETGYERFYTPGAAYGDYFESENPLFPVWQRSESLPDKARIFAIQIDGIAKAYPLEILFAEEVVNDLLLDTPLVLVAGRGEIIVEGRSLRSAIESGDLEGARVRYESGGEVRAYLSHTEVFEPGSEPGQLLDSKGGSWRITEEALLGPEGQVFDRMPGHLAYWFGWFAFFPHTQVYGE